MERRRVIGGKQRGRRHFFPPPLPLTVSETERRIKRVEGEREGEGEH
jgi:hypothetical protein